MKLGINRIYLHFSEDSRSDIMQLQSIDELELFELIEVGQLKPQSKKLIQLAHQVSFLSVHWLKFSLKFTGIITT